MGSISESQLENRRRITEGVASALRTTSVHPLYQAFIEMVVNGERPGIEVGTDVVEALLLGRMLRVALLTANDLDAPGWKHTEKGTVTPNPPLSGPAMEREMRVIGYHLAEPGLKYREDIGGWLRLEAIRESGITDYNRWRLSWASNELPEVGQVIASPIHRRPGRPRKHPVSNSVNSTDKPPNQKSERVRWNEGKPRLRNEPQEIELPEDVTLAEGQVWHPQLKLGSLLRDTNGQFLEDDAGRLIAEFPGPPELKARIPKGLIDKRYFIGPRNLDKGKQ